MHIYLGAKLSSSKLDNGSEMHKIKQHTCNKTLGSPLIFHQTLTAGNGWVNKISYWESGNSKKRRILIYQRDFFLLLLYIFASIGKN